MQDAVVLSEGDASAAIQIIMQLSEGALEAKFIAMDAVRSKLLLQNQLLMRRVLQRHTSIAQLINCKPTESA